MNMDHTGFVVTWQPACGQNGRGFEPRAYATRSSGNGLDENDVASRFLAAITERSNEQVYRYSAATVLRTGSNLPFSHRSE